MDENEQKTIEETDKSILALLEELKEASVKLAKIRTAIAIRVAEKTVKEGVENTKDTLVNAAKQVGVDIVKNSEKYTDIKEEIRSVSEQYENIVNTISDAYLEQQKDSEVELANLDNRKRENLATRKDMNNKKREYMQGDNEANKLEIKSLNSELNQKKKEMIICVKKGDFDTVSKLNEECKSIINKKEELSSSNKEKIDSINQEIKDNREESHNLNKTIKEVKNMMKEMEVDFEEEIYNASVNKEDKIAEINSKTTMFDKIKMFFSKQIMGGVSKGNKFKEDVLKPSAEKITDFKNNKLPTAIEDMADNYQEKKDSIINKKDQFIQNTRDVINNVKNKSIELKDNVISTAKDFGQNLKEGVIDTKDKVVDYAVDSYNSGIEKVEDIKQSFVDTIEKASDFASATKGKAINSLAGLTERVNERVQKANQEYEEIRKDKPKESPVKDEI